MTDPRNNWMTFATVFAIVLGAWLAWFLGTRGSSVTEQPPAANPVVANSEGSIFMGSQSCRECHAEIVESHLKSGHSSTFAFAIDSPWAKRLDGQSFKDDERNITYHYERTDEGFYVTMPDFRPDARFPLQFALGSGKHGGVTFMTLRGRDDGQTLGIEHRVSWQGPLEHLIITPGHQGQPVRQEFDFLGLVFTEEPMKKCIGCHTTEFEVANGQTTRVLANVDCEACHGSAREHVQAMRGKDSQTKIQFGARVATARQEIEMCGRCHRLPTDFRPDELVVTNTTLSRFQPVGILSSNCFQKSNEALRCTTCHDPHADPTTTTEQSRIAACLDCHGERNETRCLVSPTSDCLRCHMPLVEVNEGMPFHDHWIRVTGGAGG